MNYHRIRSPMRDRLVGARSARRRPHLRQPNAPGRRRISRKRLGLIIAFAIAIAANVAVVVAHSQTSWTSKQRSQVNSAPVLRLAGTAETEHVHLLPAVPPTSQAGSVESMQRTVIVATTKAEANTPDPHQSAVGKSHSDDSSTATSVQNVAQAAVPSIPRIAFEMTSGRTFAGMLGEGGLTSEAVQEVIQALSGSLDFRQVRPGDRVEVELASNGSVQALEYRERRRGAQGAVYVLERSDEKLVSSRQEIPIETRQALVSGQVQSTLYESMVDTGERPSLISAFTDVFGWDIDFHREVQNGDRFKIVVEKRFADGSFIGYGRILAAEYSGHGLMSRAFYFDNGKTVGYFNDAGESMQKSFLKSPVGITRITSKFGMRFHPVHKQNRVHEGVDYGAPKGTPVWTLADGVVTTRTFNRGIGNYVKVRHPNGYETVYGHLSRFADIKVGSKVSQRQVIGYCGSTGVSTGPHVHLGMLKQGHYVNPLTQKFPRGNAIAKSARSEFSKLVESLSRQLDGIEIALAQEHLSSQG